MPFHIRDPETDRLARELAQIRGEGITDAVRSALRMTLEAERKRLPLLERIKDITDKIAAAPDTGMKADKAFFDDLWGHGDE